VSQQAHARAPGIAEASCDFDQTPQSQQRIVSENPREFAKFRGFSEQIGRALTRLQHRFSHKEIERLRCYIGDHCGVPEPDSPRTLLLRPALRGGLPSAPSFCLFVRSSV
jgi:hypothetical protein